MILTFYIARVVTFCIFSVSRQRVERDTSTETNEAPSAQHHAVGAGQQNAAVQVEQKPATSTLLSSVSSSTVVTIRDPTIRPKYVCEICNKGFKSGYNLKRHTNDYHGENASIIAAKGSKIRSSIFVRLNYS